MKKVKLRYYLRGLGIGVLVTAFILGIVNRDNGTMTDAEIREKALELGMVYEDSMVLSDLRGDDSNEFEPIVQESESKISEETEDEAGSENNLTSETETQTSEEAIVETEEQPTEEVQAEEQPTEEQPTEEQPTEEQPTEEQPTEEQPTEVLPTEESLSASEESEAVPESAIIQVYPGASSYSVSKDLKEAGLVEDAKDYDAYLCNNGYSRIIRVGTYEIAIGTSEEEIAKIITGKR